MRLTRDCADDNERASVSADRPRHDHGFQQSASRASTSSVDRAATTSAASARGCGVVLRGYGALLGCCLLPRQLGQVGVVERAPQHQYWQLWAGGGLAPCSRGCHVEAQVGLPSGGCHVEAQAGLPSDGQEKLQSDGAHDHGSHPAVAMSSNCPHHQLSGEIGGCWIRDATGDDSKRDYDTHDEGGDGGGSGGVEGGEADGGGIGSVDGGAAGSGRRSSGGQGSSTGTRPPDESSGEGFINSNSTPDNSSRKKFVNENLPPDDSSGGRGGFVNGEEIGSRPPDESSGEGFINSNSTPDNSSRKNSSTKTFPRP